jgi:hypothetical protein
MKVTTVPALVVVLLAHQVLGVAAAPNAAGSALAAGATTRPRFHLRTELQPGPSQHKARFDGLRVASYHVNADWQDLVGAPRSDLAFVLNGTHLQAELGSPYPFGVQLVEDVYATWWQAVEIHAGYGKGRFRFDGDELRAGSSWAGWRGEIVGFLLAFPSSTLVRCFGFGFFFPAVAFWFLVPVGWEGMWAEELGLPHDENPSPRSMSDRGAHRRISPLEALLLGRSLLLEISTTSMAQGPRGAWRHGPQPPNWKDYS